MFILVVGSPDSGKSLLAEELASNESKASLKYYIATMIPYGDEGKRRVEKHRRMREGKGFITLEWPDNISDRIDNTIDFSEATVLLECMSNLVGNEMYSEDNKNLEDAEIIEKIVTSIKALSDKTKSLVVVTNAFSAADEEYDDATIRYITLANMVNERLTFMADSIYIKENGEWKRYENN